MVRSGCSLVVLALAAQHVAAEPPAPTATPSPAPLAPVGSDETSPLEVTAEIHVRSIENSFADDAALDGKGPGASVRIGRDWIHLQLSWDHVREMVGDPFEDRIYDEHAHQFLLGPAFVWHAGSRVSVSGGLGVALSYYNGRDAPKLTKGGWTDFRIDVDLLEVARGHHLSINAGTSLVLANPGGIAGSVGLGYHLR